jgi:hypothetical protein
VPKLIHAIVCLGLLATACDDGGSRIPIPSAPSPVLSPAPSPFPGAPFSERYTQITLGDVVTSRVTDDDPPCVGEPQWDCQYFRLTAPGDGLLEVVMTVTPNSLGKPNLDLSFSDSERKEWWSPVIAPVKAGSTYQITVWEYAFPGVEFELRFLLR